MLNQQLLTHFFTLVFLALGVSSQSPPQEITQSPSFLDSTLEQFNPNSPSIVSKLRKKVSNQFIKSYPVSPEEQQSILNSLRSRRFHLDSHAHGQVYVRRAKNHREKLAAELEEKNDPDIQQALDNAQSWVSIEEKNAQGELKKAEAINTGGLDEVDSVFAKRLGI